MLIKRFTPENKKYRFFPARRGYLTTMGVCAYGVFRAMDGKRSARHLVHHHNGDGRTSGRNNESIG